MPSLTCETKVPCLKTAFAGISVRISLQQVCAYLEMFDYPTARIFNAGGTWSLTQLPPVSTLSALSETCLQKSKCEPFGGFKTATNPLEGSRAVLGSVPGRAG